MCFSPTASFLTAGVTGVIGVVCLMRATRPAELALAATPLLFGAQQAIEGGLWLTLPAAPHGLWAAGLTLAFLLFAQVFWPLYAPLAAWSLEPDRRRRRLMLVCLACGAVVAGFLLRRMLGSPHDAVIANRCIVYRSEGGHPVLVGLAYLAATSAPLILSSRRTILALGAIVLTGSVIAYIYYWQGFQSVWCFFAALGSVVILAHFMALGQTSRGVDARAAD